MLSPMLPLACERVTIVKALWHRIKTLTYRSSISVNESLECARPKLSEALI